MHLNHVRSGSGEPLLLLHGIGDSLAAWTPVGEILAAHHEVIAVDLPGFGGSSALPGAEPTPAALAGVIAGFMGPEPFHVAGNSLGGGIALELAKAGRVLSATAFSPIGFARGWERVWLRVALELTRTLGPAIGLRLGTRAASWLMMNRPRPRDVLAKGLADLARAPGWRATLPPSVAYTFSGSIDVPLTIAWGEDDKVLLPRQASRARAALPQARHIALRDCGHVPGWDDPERVAAAILSATRSPRPPAPAAA